MRNYDFLILGGGIVGLTIARELSRNKLGSVCLIDKEPKLGLHASGRNSGVLHAGIYYSPDSLKAKVCSRGAKAMMIYAEEQRIPMQKIGKVIVAAVPQDVPTVRKLYERALANGIRAELIDEKKLKEIEPEAKTCELALYSPDTAIIDSKAVLYSLEKEIKTYGVEVIKDAEIKSLEAGKLCVGNETFSFGYLINASGLHADSSAHQMGVGTRYSILPFKGIYHKISKEVAGRFRGLIYPAPDLSVPFLGVHTTKTTEGEMLAGPTAIPAFGRENYGIFSGVDRNCFRIAFDLSSLFLKNTDGFRKMMWQEIAKYNPQNFLKDIQRLAPILEQKHLLGVGKVGLRAQLFDRIDKKLVMDFVVEDGPRSTHILNAISPAFTSSLAFAEMIVERIRNRR